MDKIKKIGIGFGIFVASFFILIVIVAVTNFEQDKEEQELRSKLRSMSIEELEELSVSWDYDDVLRNPEKYAGRIVHLTVEIKTVTPVGEGHYSLTVWPSDGLDITFVDYTGSRVLTGDVVIVYGVFNRVIDVKSMLADVTNPYPVVKAIRLTCINC